MGSIPAFHNQVRSFILVSDVYSLSLSKHLSELLRVSSLSFFLKLFQDEGEWYDLGVIFTFLGLNFSFAVECESSPPPL